MSPCQLWGQPVARTHNVRVCSGQIPEKEVERLGHSEERRNWREERSLAEWPTLPPGAEARSQPELPLRGLVWVCGYTAADVWGSYYHWRTWGCSWSEQLPATTRMSEPVQYWPRSSLPAAF